MQHRPARRIAASPASRVPVYRMIERHIREMISRPEYGPGARIPSERTLAETLGANRMTVRKAMDGLVAAGLLERNGTSGTRIPPPRVVRPLEARTAHGVSRLVRRAGGSPGNKLLHFAPEPASAPVAARLGLAPGGPVFIIRRLWAMDAAPFCIETSHLPADRLPGLAAEDLAAGQSLYALLRARYGIEPHVRERVISVAEANALEAGLLDLAAGTSCLLLRLVATDAEGTPIETMHSVNHPGRVVFATELPDLTAMTP